MAGRYGAAPRMSSMKGIWITGLIISGVALILVLERWALGSFLEDPLAGAPFILQGDAIRFKEFPLEFNQTSQGKYTTRFENGTTAVYTIDAALQKEMERFFKRYRVPYGVFVAMEPVTGKVLAIAEYSEENPKAERLALRSTYPAASIFKLVTASAAIEEKKATPETEIAYHGGLYRLGPRNWIDNPKRDKLKITFGEALAKSCNVAFAKVALRWLSAPALLAYGERFQFNRPIPFELPVQVSRMEIEDSERGVARTAAGFGQVGLSPLHAAMIGAAIANDGVMMTPCLVDFVLDSNGNKIYECRPRPLANAVSVETAASLKKMMAMTVINGTSRKVFRVRRGETGLRGITVGGKTGSLTGEDPPGKYSWFVGMAPMDAPEIAVAALVINRPKWRIKATEVAKAGLTAYFHSDPLRRVADR
ncbi:MAG TPA: penicillin-binding transpeptidase domain-containing protein [Candidatus Manganitrophaceae bacterium]|nr:penicillin-binding transpeptidase domain-containing protein [Candidatus Manganitrophaceae bacterium]